MKKIVVCIILILFLAITTIPCNSIFAQNENITDTNLIISELNEQGIEVNASMVETAKNYSFEDMVIEGDGIQGNLISTDKPIPANEIAGLEKEENLSLTTITPIYASIVIAADEEYRSMFPQWKTKTYEEVEKIDNYFIENFGLDFIVTRFVEYSSNDSISDGYELLKDSKNKIDKKNDLIVLVFNGQYSGILGGVAQGDTAIIFNHVSYSWFAEDNIVQHELSHLFGAPDHNPGILHWCVMSYFWNWFTHSWCNECLNAMNTCINDYRESIKLKINTNKNIYFPGENVSIVAKNTGENILTLKKWFIEKKISSEIWEEIYESNKFSNDYISIIPFIPINNTPGISPYVAINYANITSSVYPFITINNTPIISLIEPYSNLPGDNTLVITDWSSISGLVISNWRNGSAGVIQSPNDIYNISIISSGEPYSILPGNNTVVITDLNNISGSVIGNHGAGSAGGTQSVNDNVTIEDPFIITPYVPTTSLYPSQQISWIWSQITYNGISPGFGEYRVKIEYDDKYAYSESFHIAYYLQTKEQLLIDSSAINATPLMVYTLSENPLVVTKKLSFPDSIYVCDGFLIDYEIDGVYDAFQSLVYENRTDIEQDSLGNYLIDNDGDGKWEYTYNPASGESKTYASTNDDRGIPGFELILVVCAIAIFLFWKRKRI